MTESTIQKFWRENHKARHNDDPQIGPFVQCQLVRCADGFEISVQASRSHYCTPRTYDPVGGYSEWEIGFPTAREELIMPFVEDESDPTGTVYGYVPTEIIDQVIAAHGGLRELRTFPTLVVASAACGVGLCEMKFSQLHEVTTFASGLDIFTHEMGHGPTMDRVRAEIRRNLPDMPSPEEASADWRAAAEMATAAYGEEVSVPAGSLTRENHPIGTLLEMTRAPAA